MAEEEKSGTPERIAGANLYLEKRRHKRVSTIIMADLYLPDRNNQLIGRGCITDLSISGVQVETKEPITTEDPFAVRFYLPNGMGFENIRSKIMRARKQSFTNVYGIKFMNIGIVDRARIWWYIHTR